MALERQLDEPRSGGKCSAARAKPTPTNGTAGRPLRADFEKPADRLASILREENAEILTIDDHTAYAPRPHPGSPSHHPSRRTDLPNTAVRQSPDET